MRVSSPLGAVARLLMGMAGGYIAWRAAPDMEMLFFPVLTEIAPATDPDDPGTTVRIDGNLVCWFIHVHKVRDVQVIRRSIAVVMPDGSRYFAGPIDGRTGLPFNSRDAKPVGFAGTIRSCASLPQGIDIEPPFKIEVFSQYRPVHALWLLDQAFPTIEVAPSKEARP